MSEFSRTDYTKLATETKQELDKFFRIPLKEDADFIIKKMEKRNTKINSSSLGDLDDELLKILAYDEKYMSENYEVSSDGKIVAKSLFKKSYEDAKSEEDKKPYEKRRIVSKYRDIERNAKVIAEYEEYVKNLKSLKELDKLFLEKLNTKYTEYRSSTDYMTRLVKRLMKYNFNYSEQSIDNVETRVLILRQLINAYGYDCVNEISSPELEDIVVKEFGGDVEKITDDVFKYLEGDEEETVYNKDYISALVELQATIIYKSSTICMTKELCEELCALICKKATVPLKNKKTEKISKKILTDFAINGTAKLLKDCFYEPSNFAIQCIKKYKNADIDKIVVLNKKLETLYKEGKKEMRDSFSDIDESIRLSVFFEEFSERINVSEKISSLFSKVFPKIVLSEGSILSDCITETNMKTIKCIKQSNIVKNSEKLVCVRDLLDECEKELDKEARKQYLELLYKKIGERFNGATNPSKKAGLYKKATEIFDTEKTEYMLLKIADDLANARFSSYGKTREYIYIFAIAFGMTSTGYSEDSIVADKITGDEKLKEDPRKITDIQKNLFWDYYADNIVNNSLFVGGNDDKKRKVTVDGYGINYKNFAEVTFLWCMRQDSLKPDEKLELAYEIIEYCKKNGKSEEDFKNSALDSGEEKTTQVYKTHYNDTAINITDKSEFENYLIENYPCKFNGNVMMVNGSGLSAAKEFEEQQERVKNLLKKVENYMFDDWNFRVILKEISAQNDSIKKYFVLRHYVRELKCKNCKRKKGGMFPNCYAFFEPYSWIDKNGKERKISSCEDFCKEKCKEKSLDDTENMRKSLKSIAGMRDDCESDFERRLTKLSYRCSRKQADLKKMLRKIEDRVNIKVLNSDKKDVSRTALIALCYFEMVLANYLSRNPCDDECRENGRGVVDMCTFEEFYTSFCDGRTSILKYEDSETEKEETFVYYYPGANVILENAGYQRINSKNLFDVYVIFLAFKDNYKALFSLPNVDRIIDKAKKESRQLEKMKKEIELNRNNENDIPKDR